VRSPGSTILNATRSEEPPKCPRFLKSREIGSSKKRAANHSSERSHTLNRRFLGKFREFSGLLVHCLKLVAGVLGGYLNELGWGCHAYKFSGTVKGRIHPGLGNRKKLLNAPPKLWERPAQVFSGRNRSFLGLRLLGTHCHLVSLIAYNLDTKHILCDNTLF
jgi:hypothetical protein